MSADLDKPPFIWFNGEVRPWHEATVHVWSEVVLRAASVFEGLRGYWCPSESRHYFLHLDAHMARLAESVKQLRIPAAVTADECRDALDQLISALGYREDIYGRPTVFLEKGRYSIAGSADDAGFFMPVFTSPREPTIDSGLTCQVSSWRRSDDTTAPPRIKAAANYYNLRLARMEATGNGFDEAILLNSRGFIAETGGASVFIVKDGKVATPSVSSSILDSITRRSAIAILRDEMGMEVVERDVERTELYTADEAFLTGTLCEITPIVAVDRLPVGDGNAGRHTHALQGIYYARCHAGSNDEHGWLTPGPVLDLEAVPMGKR
jgi:branched-chain amino acid aminotransferase